MPTSSLRVTAEDDAFVTLTFSETHGDASVSQSPNHATDFGACIPPSASHPVTRRCFPAQICDA
jgi:hypothetical protein